MKATAIVAACALVFGTAAMAQAQQDNTSRTENSAGADQMKPADDAQRTKNAVKHMGEKTRHAMHRGADKAREMAHNDKDHRGYDKHARADRDDRHARADHDMDRHHERHARADRDDRHHDRYARNDRRMDDTRSMGASGYDMRDGDHGRQQRMDDAYESWKARQQKNG